MIFYRLDKLSKSKYALSFIDDRKLVIEDGIITESIPLSVGVGVGLPASLYHAYKKIFPLLKNNPIVLSKTGKKYELIGIEDIDIKQCCPNDNFIYDRKPFKCKNSKGDIVNLGYIKLLPTNAHQYPQSHKECDHIFTDYFGDKISLGDTLFGNYSVVPICGTVKSFTKDLDKDFNVTWFVELDVMFGMSSKTLLILKQQELNKFISIDKDEEFMLYKKMLKK